jgi:hypothetical protein
VGGSVKFKKMWLKITIFKKPKNRFYSGIKKPISPTRVKPVKPTGG